jgi:hypothetical protein
MRSLAAFAVAAALLGTGCATGLTGDPVSLSGTKARLGGNVVSSVGGPVEYWFQYGPTTSYGSESARSTAPSTQANQPHAVVADLAGLARSTTYHYRLCASDSDQQGGPGCGEDRTLTTSNLGCGDVITQDFRLSATTTCETEPIGLVIGADGVDLNLNGHGVNGPAGHLPEDTTGVGVDNSSGHDDVTLRNGNLLRWGNAVRLSGASFNVIRDVDMRQGNNSVRIAGGESNTIRLSDMTGFDGGGLFAAGSDALVVADSSGFQWRVSGDDARLVRNTIGAGIVFDPCLIVSGNRNRVADNHVAGCTGGGVYVNAGSNTAVVGNGVAGFPTGEFPEIDGIRVQPFTAGTLLQGNDVQDFDDDGIDVRAPATTLTGNHVGFTGDFSIDAVAGVTDGGGNTASGECRNVSCGP